MIRHTQETRKQRLREMCDSDKNTSTGRKHRLEDISSGDLKRLIVDDNHGIIFCVIPKVMHKPTAHLQKATQFGHTASLPTVKEHVQFDLVPLSNTFLYLAFQEPPDLIVRIFSTLWCLCETHRHWGNSSTNPSMITTASFEVVQGAKKCQECWRSGVGYKQELYPGVNLTNYFWWLHPTKLSLLTTLITFKNVVWLHAFVYHTRTLVGVPIILGSWCVSEKFQCFSYLNFFQN